MISSTTNSHRIRSFVGRNSRATPGQERALETLFPLYGLQVSQGLIDLTQVFGRQAPTLLEIGFGTGQSLLALAKARPDLNLIGVETHKPGVGALLLGAESNALTNLRVFNHDVVDVLEQSIPNASLDGIQIFFPDPWQKRRHAARRLVQPAFLQLVMQKLVIGGTLHLATDWQEYADHMLQVISAEKKLCNLAGAGQFGTRSPYRPVLSKFERRAEREGRAVWELQLRFEG